MKRIGFNEKFWLYVFVHHKQAPALKEKLDEKGFYYKEKDRDSDHELKILATPFSASSIHAIIKEIVN